MRADAFRLMPRHAAAPSATMPRIDFGHYARFYAPLRLRLCWLTADTLLIRFADCFFIAAYITTPLYCHTPRYFHAFIAFLSLLFMRRRGRGR